MLKEIQEALTVDRLGNDAHRQASEFKLTSLGAALKFIKNSTGPEIALISWFQNVWFAFVCGAMGKN